MIRRDHTRQINPRSSTHLEWEDPRLGVYTFQLMPPTVYLEQWPEIADLATQAKAAIEAFQAADDAGKADLLPSVSAANAAMCRCAGRTIMLMWCDRDWDLEAQARYRSMWYVDNPSGDDLAPAERAGEDAYNELYRHGFSHAHIMDLFAQLSRVQTSSQDSASGVRGVEANLRFFGGASLAIASTAPANQDSRSGP